MRTLLAALLVITIGLIFATTTAHAMTGDETVASYRTWSDHMQTGYVLGIMASLTRHGDMRCANPPTVGVMRAWLESHLVQPGDNLPDVMLRLFIQKHGCSAVKRDGV